MSSTCGTKHLSCSLARNMCLVFFALKACHYVNEPDGASIGVKFMNPELLLKAVGKASKFLICSQVCRRQVSRDSKELKEQILN